MMPNHPEKKQVKKISELPLKVPFFLFPNELKQINKDPAECITHIYRDCSNVTNRMQITFNGTSIPDECLPVDPDSHHKKIPSIEEVSQETVENFSKFKQFFIDQNCLTEEGFKLLITMHDQSNLGKYQFLLQQVADHHKLVFGNAKLTRANYFYDDKRQALILEVINVGLQLKELSDPEKESELFKNATIGCTIIKTSQGISVSFRTDSPTILIKLFELYIHNHFIKSQSPQSFFKTNKSNLKQYTFLLETISKDEKHFADILQGFNTKDQLDIFIHNCISLQTDILIETWLKSKEEQCRELIKRIENVVIDTENDQEMKQLQAMIKAASQKTTLLVQSYQLPNLMQSAGLHVMTHSEEDDFIIRAKKRLTMFKLLGKTQNVFLLRLEKLKSQNLKMK